MLAQLRVGLEEEEKLKQSWANHLRGQEWDLSICVWPCHRSRKKGAAASLI